MNVKELRVGNYIGGLNDLKQISVVCTISENDIGYERLSDSEYFQGNSFIPIPLTEDWLLKFGFTALSYLGDGVYENKHLYIESYNERKMTKEDNERLKDYFGVWFGDEYNGKWIVNLKYVHQLQNLYFALTGEELEIKE